MLDGPEGRDCQFESIREGESSDVSFEQSNSTARVRGQSIRSSATSGQHIIGLIEPGDKAFGLRCGDVDPPGATTQFESLASLTAETDIKIYFGP